MDLEEVQHSVLSVVKDALDTFFQEDSGVKIEFKDHIVSQSINLMSDSLQSDRKLFKHLDYIMIPSHISYWLNKLRPVIYRQVRDFEIKKQTKTLNGQVVHYSLSRKTNEGEQAYHRDKILLNEKVAILTAFRLIQQSQLKKLKQLKSSYDDMLEYQDFSERVKLQMEFNEQKLYNSSFIDRIALSLKYSNYSTETWTMTIESLVTTDIEILH